VFVWNHLVLLPFGNCRDLLIFFFCFVSLYHCVYVFQSLLYAVSNPKRHSNDALLLRSGSFFFFLFFLSSLYLFFTFPEKYWRVGDGMELGQFQDVPNFLRFLPRAYWVGFAITLRWDQDRSGSGS
jgi:hypothetical protein